MIRFPIFDMKKLNIKGSWPALVTPMMEEDEVDYEVLKTLVEFHVENHSDGILILGSTGEAPLLTIEGKTRIIDDAARGKIPSLCGISAPTTRQTIENARYAKEAGSDGGLIVQPGYVRLGQEALYRYFRKVAEAVDT